MSMDKEEEKKTPSMIKREFAIKIIKKWMEKGVEMTQKEQADYFEVDERTVRSYTREIKDRIQDGGGLVNNNGLNDNEI